MSEREGPEPPKRGAAIDIFPSTELGSLKLPAICGDNLVGNSSLSHKGVVTGFLVVSGCVSN